MDSKAHILNALQSHATPAADLPSLDQTWQTFADPVCQFDEALRSVGGNCVRIGNRQALDLELAQLEPFRLAQRIGSTVSGIWQANVDLAACDDPHQLADLDFLLARGTLAVAENGAVWVDDPGLKQRVALFISRHLALLVPTSRVVHNMHEAYAQLTFQTPGFGVFISGPSKTADIEQSLVIGAHGPRSLTVFLVDEPGQG